MNPLLSLNQCGQFVWLDHISRSLFTDDRLKRLIEEDGLGGVTSNPTIFQKAIGGSTDYDAALQRALDADRGISDRADTITTGPPATMDAFRDHGRVRVTLGTEATEAEAVFATAEALALTCTRSLNSYRRRESKHSPLRSINWSPQ